MSRIGKMPVTIPQGVDVAIKQDQISVKGTGGNLSLALNELPVRSACEKSEPRSMLASNFPPGAATPAKSLPRSMLASNLVTI